MKDWLKKDKELSIRGGRIGKYSVTVNPTKILEKEIKKDKHCYVHLLGIVLEIKFVGITTSKQNQLINMKNILRCCTKLGITVEVIKELKEDEAFHDLCNLNGPYVSNGFIGVIGKIENWDKIQEWEDEIIEEDSCEKG